MIYFEIYLIQIHVCIYISFQSRNFEHIYISIGTISKINEWVKQSILTYEIKIFKIYGYNPESIWPYDTYNTIRYFNFI